MDNPNTNKKIYPLDLIKEIELEYPVETIKVLNIQIWPYLRIYLGSLDDYFATTSKSRFFIIKTFFTSIFYGFFQLFKSYNYFFFSDTKERRKIGQLLVDKSIDPIIDILPKSLTIEIPLPNHFKRKNIPQRRIISKVLFYFIETLYVKLFLNFIKIENEQLIKQILSEKKLELNYKSVIKKLISQYKITQLISRIYKPKAVFIICYYTNIGRILAFKEKQIPVIEIQHGVINDRHLAYNIFKSFSTQYFPDYLFSFGNNEKDLSESVSFYLSNNKVFPIGSYYLDFINSNPIVNNQISKFRNEFKYLICVSGQNHYTESFLISFLKSVTGLCSEIVFLYVPRDNTFNDKKYNLNRNIIVLTDLNCYEVISVCDFHATVFSSCALEAPSLGVRNVLINIDGLSKLHYGDVLNNPQTTVYADSSLEFIDLVKESKHIEKELIRALNQSIIVPNYNKNLLNALNELNIQ